MNTKQRAVPCGMKTGGLNGFAKSIDSRQAAQHQTTILHHDLVSCLNPLPHNATF